MAEKQETHADIIAEMRIFKCRDLETGKLELCNAIGSYFADRLEAAHKREMSKNMSKNGADFRQLGDAAKLREALQKAAESAAEIMERVRHKDGLAFNTANYIASIAKDALATPPRNCDVGTAEEQEKRYNEWLNADVGRAVLGLDPLEWAQMPYEEGGEK